MLFAKSTKDFSLCDKIANASNDYNDCYKEFSVILRDPSLCEKISDQGYRDLCYYAYVNSYGDATLCEKSGHFKTECYKYHPQSLKV